MKITVIGTVHLGLAYFAMRGYEEHYLPQRSQRNAGKDFLCGLCALCG